MDGRDEGGEVATHEQPHSQPQELDSSGTVKRYGWKLPWLRWMAMSSFMFDVPFALHSALLSRSLGH